MKNLQNSKGVVIIIKPGSANVVSLLHENLLRRTDVNTNKPQMLVKNCGTCL